METISNLIRLVEHGIKVQTEIYVSGDTAANIQAFLLDNYYTETEETEGGLFCWVIPNGEVSMLKMNNDEWYVHIMHGHYEDTDC